MAAPRVGWSGRETLVDADIVEAWPAASETLEILLDQFERWIGDFFVVVPPLAHETVRIVVDLRGVRML